MNRNLIRIFAGLILLGITVALSAQTAGQSLGRRSSNFQLSITANIRARVTITNQTNRNIAPTNGATNMTISLPAGNYLIEVSAPGYATQSRVIQLNRNIAQNFVMQATSDQPSTVQLNITSNINGARVQISGATNAQGNTPLRLNLPRGTYSVSVSAPGYPAQTRSINLDRNLSENFNFVASTARLNITSNVNGALVQISGASNAQGNTPWRTDLPMGIYNVTVSAPGYGSQTQSVNLRSHMNLHFNLKREMATLQIIIPPESLNTKDINARSRITVYDNGTLMNGSTLTLQPGQHTIQLISGGLMTQTTIVAEAGKTYTIKPILSLLIQ